MVELLPTLEVCDAPKGESVPVAFMLAGFPDDHSCYAKLAEGMKKTHRVVIACLPLYDQESVKEGQPDFYSWEEILFRLEATVFGCTAEGEKITLIIHDFGCPFGYHFANLHPDKVEKLVGLDIGCTNRLVLAGEGSRHRYRHVKFPAMSPPEPPEKWNKLNQAFYQLYFCMAFLVGQKVNYKAGDVLLHAFFKWAAWVGFIQSKDQPESKHARALQDVHCWMCYPYWACWSRILFQKKSHMFTHTYESQYTNPKGKSPASPAPMHRSVVSLSRATRS